MNILAQFNSVLFQAAEKTLILFMGIIAMVIPYEVFGRYVQGDMPLWSGEAATFSLVWVSMLGGAVGLRKGAQASVTLLQERMPARCLSVFALVGSLALLAVLSILVYYGLLQTIANWRQISPALGVSMAFPYLAVPVGFGLMWLISFEKLLVQLQGLVRRKGRC